jgi:phage baseplate assembly protein gpV
MDIDQIMFRLAEQDRRIRNLIRFTEVTAVDPEKGTAESVDRGGGPGHDLPLRAMPWAETGAPDKSGTTWRPPTKGSRMMVVSPSGNLADGLLFHAGFSDQVAAPSKDPNAHVETRGKARVEWSDEKIELSHGGAVVTLKDGKITLKADTVEIDAAQLFEVIGKEAFFQVMESYFFERVKVPVWTQAGPTQHVFAKPGL